MKPIERVVQPNNAACGVACLAMLLAWPYDHVVAALGHRPEQFDANGHSLGLAPYEVESLFLRMGIPSNSICPREQLLLDGVPVDRRLAMSTSEVLAIIRARSLRGMALVPSRHRSDLHHWVVFDGPIVHDPSAVPDFRVLQDITTIVTAVILNGPLG